MRTVVFGASGNVGTAVLSALIGDPAVGKIRAVARRIPADPAPGVEWVRADIRTDDLAPICAGADAVVHLAWMMQPMHAPLDTWRGNVTGTERVLRAVAAASVPSLVYTSSVGAYSPRTDLRPVAESWPTDGRPTAAYTREKAYVERLLDTFEWEHPGCRIVRLRPAFVFQRAAAAEQRRLFLGPFFPNRLLHTGAIPVLPLPASLVMQAVHAADVAAAVGAALVREVGGPFNLAAEPVLDRTRLARVFGARPVTVPDRLFHGALAAAWGLRLAPAAPELFAAFLRLPVLDSGRAAAELRWRPRYTAEEALRELLDGLRDGAGGPTPALATDAGGRWRWREVRSGIGGYDPVDREPAAP
ncbi:NAD-dependent epimerase/dehydratase family protein [Nocardia sp. NPDC057353]|uniref:NAD-dependent epimerase/dehydratase family protein n=1 Tax=Nocardia sp. NPDC057353 TaxID=3346104 RepID=UPI003641C7CD